MVILRKNLSKRNSSQKNTKGRKSKKYNKKTIYGGVGLSQQQLLDLSIEKELKKDSWDLLSLRSELTKIVDDKIEELIDNKIQLYTLNEGNAAKKFFNRNEIIRLSELISKLETEYKQIEDNCIKKVGAIEEELLKREGKPSNHLEQELCVKKPIRRTFMRDTHVKHSKLALYNKYNPTNQITM